MGFVEETGAAQHYRDARILTIYEGTTAIQANDLIGRKLTQDGGKAMAELIATMRATLDELDPATAPLATLRTPLSEAIDALEEATGWLLRTLPNDVDAALVGAVNYLMLTGYVCGGWLLARASIRAQRRIEEGDNSGFYHGKQLTAQFYAEQFLPQARALADALRGARPALDLAEELF